MAQKDLLDFIHSVASKIYHHGEVIFSEGDYSNGRMYFVFDGELSVMKGAEQKEIAVLKAGNFFGEMAIIKPNPRIATIKVKSKDAKVGIIDKESFIQMSKTTPGFLFVLLRTAIERLIEAEARIEKLEREKRNP